MESFILLDHNKENELISEDAHKTLLEHSRFLITQWE